jgi:C-terminal processing protease CtpA/Prc
LDLPRGLVAYVPLRARRDASGHTLPRGESSSLALRGEPTGWQPSGNDRATRLAAAIEAWNLAQHFFPYFHVVHTDWAAQLPIALREAANDRDADAFGATMQRMMAALHDGHAHADNGVSRIYVLPFDWEWTAENAMVVTDVDAGVQNVHRGDIVEAIGGRSIGALLRQGEPFVSAANEASRRYYTLLSEVAQASTQSVALTLRGADGVHHEYVTPVLRPPSQKPVIAELGHGIFYVDLTRLTDDQLTQNMQLLIDARGIVIDVRGYPTGAAISLLRHLVRDTVRSDLFQTPTYYLPNREGVTYQDNRWDVGALAPRIDSPVVFMTDANAISYGESIMGVVENEQLGPIVGAATAGTNGDIVTATLVGGMAIRFTGLVARRPDGLNRHGIGIRPTIPVQPTIAGIRAGRDEVLDVAVAAAERAASATTSRATR